MVPLEPENMILKKLMLLNNDILSVLRCPVYRGLDPVLDNLLKFEIPV